MGLGLYSFRVRELLASLVLFTIAFFILGLAAFGMFFLCRASAKVVIWTRPASRNMIALSRRLIAAYTPALRVRPANYMTRSRTVHKCTDERVPVIYDVRGDRGPSV